MEYIRTTDEPQLDRPVFVCAFEGWNDAGDAASTAVRYLEDRWRSRPIAEIDPEEFYDFSAARPHIELQDGDERELVWPRNQFSAGHLDGVGDIVTLVGLEPHLRWRTFTQEIIEYARSLDARLVVTCGALISDVPHSRPVPIYGTGHDAASMVRLNAEASTYEGPTGIVGVLNALCSESDIPTASLWAAVPSYVSQAPSPKAALALVERIGKLLEAGISTTDLEIASAAYERQVGELVARDDETAGLVAELEQRHDELNDTGSLVEEVEQFLREHPDD
ncbi:MAG: PAC2 family protein [Actinomycetota bacterium]|nr:PAC2 family protein [Actinomycetota bacterium]